ncbi:MAG TPA: alpha-N-arabinofuranosidase [bacterium]
MELPIILVTIILIIGMLFQTGDAQPIENKIIVNADLGKHQISKHIYGHFSEHLGRCIYGGYWVGEGSDIPNTRGIRNDVVKALRDMGIPNLRWPGGCFADTYHWMDGIGPRDKRPEIVNVHWGGVTEDNSFGTHEFMDLCDQLGCEPVICGNVGSGTVQEMAGWIEYLTSDAQSPMTNLRKQNGRELPWKVKYWGIGNESWGCGGSMTAEYYSNQLRQYATYCRNYGENRIFKIACGPNVDDYHWTEVIMSEWNKSPGWLKGYLDGLSLHHYTLCYDWNKKGSAIHFDKGEWFTTLSKTLKMDEFITKHSVIMDKYDPEKRIALVVDEWGNWHDVEPGTNPGFLYQQNTLRDALVAAVNLDIFNKHCDRVKMANIAQTINVLQAMILTKDEEMVLTPSYYVFKMYQVHHDATNLPIEISCENYTHENNSIPAVSASASKNEAGSIHITLSNLNPDKDLKIKCEIRGSGNLAFKRGQIISGEKINSYNDFGKPEQVNIKSFSDVKIKDNVLSINLPAKSIVMVEL